MSDRDALLRGEPFDDFRKLERLLDVKFGIADPTWGDLRRLVLVGRDETELAEARDVLQLLNKYSRRAVSEVTKGITRACRRVCRIDNGGGDFTGILVAPDLVLTAAHVMRGPNNGRPDPERVMVFFDDFTFSDGSEHTLTCRPLTTISGRELRIVSQSPPDELDYVIFRLEPLIGLAAVGDGRRSRRGWMDGSLAERPPEGRVVVLQHPNGDLMQWAEGVVLPKNDDLPRGHYAYDTDTGSGSSGAAVLNESRQLVGMHVRVEVGDGQKTRIERLISFQAIFNHLKDQQKQLPRFPPPRQFLGTFSEITLDRDFEEGFT